MKVLSYDIFYSLSLKDNKILRVKDQIFFRSYGIHHFASTWWGN